ncbi:MAG: hypothetical protein Q7R33_00970 [Nitrosarchaeum sp.]|nr:hypothetical protein [Nitrosarchaeum sp.]
MDDVKQQLIDEARQTHENIFPVSGRELSDCFTAHKDHLMFWFNTADNSTRILTRKISYDKASHCPISQPN